MTAEDMPPPGHCLKLLEWSVDEAPEQTQEEAPEESAKRTLEATQEEDVGHGQSAKRQRTGAFEMPRVTALDDAIQRGRVARMQKRMINHKDQIDANV